MSNIPKDKFMKAVDIIEENSCSLNEVMARNKPMTYAEMLAKLEDIANWDEAERKKDQWSSNPMPDNHRYYLDKVIDSLRVRVEQQEDYKAKYLNLLNAVREHCGFESLQSLPHIKGLKTLLEDKDHA